mmetsp:Transcript_27853/g.93113  ORF Transcript_27853/g.93113 Transcript_27853/m.93113 type:complete len:215 (-) Transcript_27853:711-1355(-)
MGTWPRASWGSAGGTRGGRSACGSPCRGSWSGPGRTTPSSSASCPMWARQTSRAPRRATRRPRPPRSPSWPRPSTRKGSAPRPRATGRRGSGSGRPPSPRRASRRGTGWTACAPPRQSTYPGSGCSCGPTGPRRPGTTRCFTSWRSSSSAPTTSSPTWRAPTMPRRPRPCSRWAACPTSADPHKRPGPPPRAPVCRGARRARSEGAALLGPAPG